MGEQDLETSKPYLVSILKVNACFVHDTFKSSINLAYLTITEIKYLLETQLSACSSSSCNGTNNQHGK